MTTLYHVTEWDKPFVSLTNPLALDNIAKAIGADCVVYDVKEFAKREIDKDSASDAIFVVEAAYPSTARFSMKELRQYIPNGKIVVLGGDTIWFVRRNENHVEGIEEVDLWLDLMNEVVVFFNNIGIKADSWMWTISESMLDRCEEYKENLPVDFDKKEFDFVAFMTISNDYRRSFVEHFNTRKYKFATGVSCEKNNVEDMIDVYRKSWFHVGSTSPSWTTGIRTMKGFRDWLAPALNTVLLYDDFQDVRDKFGGGSIVPLYNYNSFESLELLMHYIRENTDLYEYLLRQQKLWVEYNTLEKQFLRRFIKHDIIPKGDYRHVSNRPELSAV